MVSKLNKKNTIRRNERVNGLDSTPTVMMKMTKKRGTQRFTSPCSSMYSGLCATKNTPLKVYVMPGKNKKQLKKWRNKEIVCSGNDAIRRVSGECGHAGLGSWTSCGVPWRENGRGNGRGVKPCYFRGPGIARADLSQCQRSAAESARHLHMGRARDRPKSSSSPDDISNPQISPKCPG